jgi:invasion protein IalB
MTSIQKSPLMRTALKALSPLALLLLLPAAAHAQAAEGAPPQASSESIWIKVCSTDQASKQKVCITRADLRGENGSFVSSVTIQQVGDEKRYGVGVLMPLGVLLPAGVKLAVDGAALATAQFTICLPQRGHRSAAGRGAPEGAQRRPSEARGRGSPEADRAAEAVAVAGMTPAA